MTLGDVVVCREGRACGPVNHCLFLFHFANVLNIPLASLVNLMNTAFPERILNRLSIIMPYWATETRYGSLFSFELYEVQPYATRTCGRSRFEVP
jgi:hypothetical protein